MFTKGRADVGYLFSSLHVTLDSTFGWGHLGSISWYDGYFFEPYRRPYSFICPHRSQMRAWYEKDAMLTMRVGPNWCCPSRLVSRTLLAVASSTSKVADDDDDDVDRTTRRAFSLLMMCIIWILGCDDIVNYFMRESKFSSPLLPQYSSLWASASHS